MLTAAVLCIRFNSADVCLQVGAQQLKSQNLSVSPSNCGCATHRRRHCWKTWRRGRAKRENFSSCLRKRPKSQQKIWASCAHLMLPQLGRKKGQQGGLLFKNLSLFFCICNTYTSKLMLCLDLKMNYLGIVHNELKRGKNCNLRKSCNHHPNTLWIVARLYLKN